MMARDGASVQAFVAIPQTRSTALSNPRVCQDAALGDGLKKTVVALRGGKTVGSKKSSASKGSSSSSKNTTGKAKGANKSPLKSRKKDRKPTLMATIKAFFVSLINPHFTLKLEAKKSNQVHTVHGTGSTTAS